MAAGSIVIDLLMRTGSFTTDTQRANKELAKLKKEAADIGRVVGVAFAGAITATAVFVKQTIDAADEMGKAAQKAGVTVEALSGLKYAADLAGVSFEGLQTGLKKLSVNLFDANRGLKEQEDTFAALGISIKGADGNLKDADVVLSEVADRFKNMKDGAEKTAIAVKAFGKAGADLIPLLNGGSAGIKELTDEAERMGIVLDTKTARAAEEFNDQMSRVGYAFDGIKLQLASALLPLLNAFADEMVGSAKASKDLADTDVTTWAQDTAYAIAFTADAANAARATFVQFGKSLAVVFNDIKTFTQIGALVANPISAFMNRDKIAKLTRDNAAFTKAANDDLQAYLNGNYTKFRDSLSKTYSSAASIKKNYDALLKSNPSSSSSKGSKGRKVSDIQDDAFLEEIQRIGKELEDEGKRIADVNQFIADSFDEESLRIQEALGDDGAIKYIQELKEEAASIYKETRTPLENFTAEMEKLKLLFEGGFFGEGAQAAETLGRAMQQSYDEFSKSTEETTDEITEFWKEAARNMQDAMSDFFFDAMQGDLSDLAGNFKRTIDRMVSDLLASQLSDFLFGGEFGKSGELGGVAGDFFSGLGGFFGDLLPSFDVGTPYVPQDMVANIHRGERILTADENRKFSRGEMGGSATVVMNIQTPNADSFRKSQPQIMAEAQRGLNRGRRVT